MAAPVAPGPLRKLLMQYVKADGRTQKLIEEEFPQEFKQFQPLVAELKKLQREQRLLQNRERAIKRQEESLAKASKSLQPHVGEQSKVSNTALDVVAVSEPEGTEEQIRQGDFVQRFLMYDNDIHNGQGYLERERKLLRQMCADRQVCQPTYHELTLQTTKRGSIWLEGVCMEHLSKRIKICSKKQGILKVASLP